MRLAVGLSGGADSVALLCALVERSRELGLVLHAAHLHHGLRGAEADGDLAFCRDLAAKFGLPFHETRVDTAAEARRVPTLTEGEENSASDSIEGTARRLRYQWFRKLISEAPLDAVATAHTLDDQAETVLAKFLLVRGRRVYLESIRISRGRTAEGRSFVRCFTLRAPRLRLFSRRGTRRGAKTPPIGI